jgi:hypothetical protein
MLVSRAQLNGILTAKMSVSKQSSSGEEQVERPTVRDSSCSIPMWRHALVSGGPAPTAAGRLRSWAPATLHLEHDILPEARGVAELASVARNGYIALWAQDEVVERRERERQARGKGGLNGMYCIVRT